MKLALIKNNEIIERLNLEFPNEEYYSQWLKEEKKYSRNYKPIEESEKPYIDITEEIITTETKMATKVKIVHTKAKRTLNKKVKEEIISHYEAQIQEIENQCQKNIQKISYQLEMQIISQIQYNNKRQEERENRLSLITPIQTKIEDIENG